MAAPDTTPARPGQANGAGDAKVNFLKVWAGEVLAAFAETNVAASRTMSRTITSGKSAQFPATWKATAAYHTPGNMLVGKVINANERVISIDDVLIADIFISDIDEAMAHWDFRSEFTKQTGVALAKEMDKNILRVGLLAARASATVTGGSGGTQITSATSRTNADALIAALFDAAQALDEKDVPSEDRYAFLLPAQYYLLVESGTKVLNQDYNPESNGSFAGGKVYRVAGIELVKTNNLPSTNVNTGPAAYQGDFTNTSCLVMHRSAVGTVKLMDLATEMAWMIQNQGTLVLSKYAVGHGILRPESAVEIKVA